MNFAPFVLAMPRPSRQAVLGDGRCFVHLTIRAHNRSFLFRSPEVKYFFYQLLLSLKSRFLIRIHHYAFMDNHFHLALFTPATENLSRFMQQAFSALATFINRRENRSGRVFGDRARTPVIQDGRHLLAVMRYQDLNPVRAHLVEKPQHYRWSSHRHYAFGQPDPLIDDAPEYLALSNVPAIRRMKYRELIDMATTLWSQRAPELTTWFFIGDPNWILAMCASRNLLREHSPPD